MANFTFPPPARQIYIHAFLDRARATTLHAAVSDAASAVNPTQLRDEITRFVPATGLQELQGSGARDELEEALITASEDGYLSGSVAFRRAANGALLGDLYSDDGGVEATYEVEVFVGRKVVAS
ncbi:hypothetical protein [Agromyces sp. NBRC 114283]|uniref:hypothetical protein n=1 Tax=Agromyces sp. NBRC 114283 TaxID=2994521 RepID=UPI0024A15CAF|nr:hypothetical protein [Agromyces sp. NBRC 114283]GLU88919.1 hypothetical protein Agsp01_11740 [Agromyces sp. NBRC 114283]